MLTISRILAWADAHHARTKRWPTRAGGAVHEAPAETWGAIDSALRLGLRGLDGGQTLAKLLDAHRSGRAPSPAMSLTVGQIRAWARQHHEWTGRWPGRDSGPVNGQDGLTWSLIDRCLKLGGHGLPGKSSLSKLLRSGGAQLSYGPPKRPLTTKQILQWANLHHMRTGAWPSRSTGRLREAPYTTWGTIDRRMRDGEFGEPMTLIRLLREQRGVWDSRGSARLTIKLILKWADAHYARTGRWPVTLSGDVHGVPGEKWVNIDMAMRNGRRGIAQKMSLSQLLTRERGASYNPHLAPLKVSEIVRWAEAYHRRTGRWPTRKSGPVYGAPGLTWSSIDLRLTRGGRGLPGGSSLARLLDEKFAEAGAV